MSEYPAWSAFQNLVRESYYNRVTAGAVACSANAALAEQVERAEQAEAIIGRQRDDIAMVDVQLGDERLKNRRLEAALTVERGLVTSAHRAENAKQKALDTERHRAEQAEVALAERDRMLERIRKAVVHHKQEAALYNNEREYDCLTAVLRIIDDLRVRAEEGAA